MPRNRPPAVSLLRRFTLGSGPLKRASDRLECLARFLLVCNLLTAVPISLAVVTTTYVQAGATATAQAADRHRVTARLLEDVPATAGEDWSSPGQDQATAAWTDPEGIEHRVTVPVPSATRAGATFPLWIDRNGNRTTRPLSHGDVVGKAVGKGIVIFAVLSMIAWGAYRSFRKLLDRNRFRRWAAEWAVVEPVWTRTVP